MTKTTSQKKRERKPKAWILPDMPATDSRQPSPNNFDRWFAKDPAFAITMIVFVVILVAIALCIAGAIYFEETYQF